MEPIETPRLRLRPLVREDLGAEHAIRSSPEVHRWLYTDAFSEDDSRQRLARLLAPPQETGFTPAGEHRGGPVRGGPPDRGGHPPGGVGLNLPPPPPGPR